MRPYHQIFSGLARAPRALPREAHYLIDECFPPDPLEWPYPDDYGAVAIGLVLRRLRDPLIALKAALWALRMNLAYNWRQGLLTPDQLAIWDRFIAQVESEEPFSHAFWDEFRTLNHQNLNNPFHGLEYFISSHAQVIFWGALRNNGIRNAENDERLILDEEDYFHLGRLVENLLSGGRTYMEFLPYALPPFERGRSNSVLRWWEILQCALPFRDMLGPPFVFDDIEANPGQFSWATEAMQALAPVLEEQMASFFVGLDDRHMWTDEWQTGLQGWTAFAVTHAVIVEINIMAVLRREILDGGGYQINIEVHLDDAATGHEITKEEFQFAPSYSITEAATVISNEVTEEVSQFLRTYY